MNSEKRGNRLFENPILEELSRTNAFVVISAFVLLSLTVFTYGLIQVQVSVFIGVTYYLLGFIGFTLAEYLIHRFVFHSGDYTNEQTWQFKIHGIHHATPRDKERLAMPLPLGFFLAAIFFLIYRILMGSYAFFFFPGFIIGYAFYLFVHYLIHTRHPPNTIFRILWKHHHMHHHKNDHEAYGVTTPFWDIIFRTMPKKILK